MRNRPWPLVLLAFLQIITPGVTLLFNAVLLGVHPKHVFGWLSERPFLEIFETLALMPIAGICIYIMKRWSYAVFFIAMGWSIWVNIRNWSYANAQHQSWALILIYIFEIALVIYFLIPSVREAYFNPRVRWWESKPRYVLNAPGVFRTKDREVKGVVVNLSEGGALFELTNSELASGTQGVLEFKILSLEFVIPAQVIHLLGLRSLGLQFEHTRETLCHYQRITKGLKLVGFPDRVPSKPWFEGLGDWVNTLFKTGKGLTPHLPNKTTKKE